MSKLAVDGGSRAYPGQIPSWPVVEAAEKRAVMEVLESGKWWMGEKVEAFERRYAEFQSAAFGVACTSGTAALEMALVACGIGAGDEVIVPPYTFIASASAVLTANAVPVFADIEADTLNLDPGAIEAALTPRTRAILPVHFCGHVCDMDRIGAIARRHGLKIVEDAAHGWGAQWQGQGAGSLGDASGFSFQLSKNMTSGEGGIMLTNDPGVAERAWSYHHIGRAREGRWYEHPFLGTNYRMTEFQAAILLCQLDRLPSDVARREAAAAQLAARLAAIPGLRLPRRDPRMTRRSWHLFDLFFVPEMWEGATRAQFLAALGAEGVPGTGGYDWPLYRNEVFRKIAAGKAGCPFTCPYRNAELPAYDRLNLPNAERACQTVIWLPHHLLLAPEEDIRRIADAFEKLWEHRSELRAVHSPV